MPEIVLTEEQTKLFRSALRPVAVKDSKGVLLGTLPPLWTEEDIAKAKQALASDQPRYTFAEVMEYLRSLEQK